MADRMLRHIPTGVLYVYQPQFATRPDFEEIIDVEAREIPDPVEPTPRKTRKAAAPAPAMIDEEKLAEEASRGLP